MAAFNFHQRRTRRWWYSGIALVAAALFAAFFIGGASANLAKSTFEGNDGNLVVDTAGNTDWANVAGLHAAADFPSGTGDNSFGQGTKENDPNVTLVSGSIPPNKSDLTRFYEASENIGGFSNGTHVFLYLAWERSNVLGNANMDFEINKKGTACLDTTSGFPVDCTIDRSVGDLLVTYDFPGSGTPVIGIKKWDGTTWVSATSGVTYEAAVNSKTVTDPITSNVFNTFTGTYDNALPCPSGQCPAGTFGEAAIDLTASGVLSAGSCDFGQATTFLKSRSSSSFTSEIKDFVAPVKTPISPCATLTVIKHTLNAAGTRAGISQSFTYTPSSNLNSGTTFTLNDGAGATGDVTCPVTSGTCNKKVFGSLGAGTYTVTESDPSPDFALTNLTCVDTGTTTGHGTTSTTTRQASVTLALGDDVTCTFTNTKQKTPSSMDTAPWIYPNDQATVSTTQQTDITGTVTFRLFGATSDPAQTALYNCQHDDGTTTATGLLYNQAPSLGSTTGTSKTVNTSNTTVKVSSTAVVYWNVSYSGDTYSYGRKSACIENINTTLTGDTGGTAP